MLQENRTHGIVLKQGILIWQHSGTHITMCHHTLVPQYSRNSAVWSPDSTSWIFYVSKSDTAFNTYSSFTSGKLQATSLLLWRVGLSNEIPFYLYILWVFLEISWCPLMLLSCSSFDKDSSRSAVYNLSSAHGTSLMWRHINKSYFTVPGTLRISLYSYLYYSKVKCYYLLANTSEL